MSPQREHSSWPLVIGAVVFALVVQAALYLQGSF